MEARLSRFMTYYVAIIEDAGPDHAVGVWFPDLPGCIAAAETRDDFRRDAVGKVRSHRLAARFVGRRRA